MADNNTNTLSSSSPRVSYSALNMDQASEMMVYEEFDTMNEMTDTSAYMSDEDSEITLSSSMRHMSSGAIPSSVTAFMKYDTKKYNLDKFGEHLRKLTTATSTTITAATNDELLRACLISSDEFHNYNNNNNGTDSSISLTSQQSNNNNNKNDSITKITIGELLVSNSPNILRHHVYDESGNLDKQKRDEKEQKLLTFGLLETFEERHQLPNQLKQGLSLVYEDHMMMDVRGKNKDISALWLDQTRHKTLTEVDFDVDIESDVNDGQPTISSISSKIKKYRERVLLKSSSTPLSPNNNNSSSSNNNNNNNEQNRVRSSSSSSSDNPRSVSTIGSPVPPLYSTATANCVDDSASASPKEGPPPTPTSPISGTPTTPKEGILFRLPTANLETYRSPSTPEIGSDGDEELAQLLSVKNPAEKTKAYNNFKLGSAMKKNSILELYEEMQPLVAAKKDMRINLDKYDLLLSRFSHNFEEQDVSHVLFETKHIEFAMQQNIGKPFESLLCSVSFYELSGVSTVSKITESYRFELGYSEEVNAGNRALFHIRKNNSRIFMLIKFSRPFKGEFNESVNEMYLRGEKVKEKDVANFNTAQKQKLFKSVQDVHSVFAWSCIPFGEALSPYEKNTTLTNIYICGKSGDMSDEKIITMIAAQDATKRPKNIPGKFEFNLQVIQSLPMPKRVVPQTFDLMVKSESGQLVPAAEINSLDTMRHNMMELTNLLYIYPMAFTANSSSFKNIQIIVSYHANDKAPKKEGYRNFMYYFSANPNDLVTQGFTQVSAKSKNPEFSDEIKCTLPANIGDTHHLLFRFFNVAHSESNLTKYGAKDFVGYAVLPILTKQRRLIAGEFVLDVQTSILQEGYLDHTDRAKIDKAFRVKFFSNSIMYPNGDCSELLSFFNLMSSENRKSLDTVKTLRYALDGVRTLSPTFHSLNPIILNQLFELLGELESSRLALMRMIMEVVEKYRLESMESLHTYIKYHFRMDVSEPLMSALSMLFDSASPSDYDHLLQNSWFFLSILIKSMTVRTVNNITKEPPLFSSTFYENLELFTRGLILFLEKNFENSAKVKRLNIVFASFMRHSLSLIDRPFVVRLVMKYIESLAYFPRKQEEVIVDMKLMFFREFFDYDHYLLLFLPNASSPANESSINQHFVLSAYIDILIKYLCNANRTIRLRAILSFREFIYKVAFDVRYQSTELKARISNLLFEFVHKFLDVMNEWREACDKDRKNASNTLAEAQRKLTMTHNKIAIKKETSRNAMKMQSKEDKISKTNYSLLQNEVKELESSKKHLIKFITAHEAELKKHQDQAKEEKRQLFSCIAYILDTMDTEVLSRFLAVKEEQDLTKLSLFLMVLQACLQSFEYQGYRSLCDFYINQYRVLSEGTVVSFEEEVDEFAGVAASNISDNRVVQPLRSRRGTVNILTGGLFGKGPNKSRATRLGGLSNAFSMSEAPKVESPEQFQRTKVQLPKNTERRVSSSIEFPSFVPTKGQDAFVSDLIKIEQHIAEHIAVLVFKCLVDIIDKNKDLVDQENDPMRVSPFMDNILRTLLNLLHLNQSKDVHIIVLSYLKFLFFEKKILLFSATSVYGSLFCEALIGLCNSKLQPVRNLATVVLYLVVRLNFETNTNIDHCQVMTILSLSRALQYTVPVYNNLQHAIECISKYAYLDQDAPGSKRWQTKHGTVKKARSPSLPVSPVASTPRPTGKATPNQGINGNFASAFNFFRQKESDTQDKMKDRMALENMASFAEDVEQLSKDLQNLLRDTVAINVTKQTDAKNPHKTEDLFFRISQLYNKIPELRHEWLFQLAVYHRHKMQYAEAAQCYLRVIALILDTLQKNSSPILANLPLTDFYKISPNLTKGLLSDGLSQNEAIPPHAWEYTETGLIKLLKTTIDYLEMAEQYESTIPLFKILLPMFESNDSWYELSSLYQHMHSIYEQIDKSYKEKTRMFASYYRLRFMGPWEQDLSGKEYVYKMPKLTKLHQMTKHVRILFGDEFELITSVKPDALSALDPNKRYLQLTSVKPYFHPEEDGSAPLPTAFSPRSSATVEPASSTNTVTAFGVMRRRGQSNAKTDVAMPSSQPVGIIERRTPFQKNNNVNHFYYEMAFTQGAKKSELPTEIYKRKVILTLESYFPCVKTRSLVARDVEIILTPVEAAIENITVQNQRLEEVLSCSPPDLQNIQMTLSGSVRASVNGGPRDIVEGFLARDERAKYDTKHIQRLNEKCHIFLKLCEIGTTINGKLSTAKHRQMHNEIEKGLQEIKQLFTEHLTPLPANHEIKQLLMIEELWSKNLGTTETTNDNTPSLGNHHHHHYHPEMMGSSNSLARESSQLRLSIPHHKFQRLLSDSPDLANLAGLD